MRSITLVLFLLLAALAGPSLAAGKPKSTDAEEARAAFQEGNALYSLGHFREALASFEKAYKLKQVQGLLFNIAQCHRQLKQFDLAVATYQSFMRLDPQNPQVDKARLLVEECEGVLKAQQGALAAPPLDVGGSDPGIKPIPVLVPPPPAITAIKPGVALPGATPPLVSGAPLEPAAPPLLPPPAAAPKPAARVATVGPAVPGAAAAAPAPPAADLRAARPAPAKATPASAPPEALTSREVAEGGGSRTVTWITAGAAVVALGGGAAFGLMSKSTASSLTGQQHTRAEIDSMQSDLSSQSAKANLLFIAGGVLAVAAGAFFVLHL